MLVTTSGASEDDLCLATFAAAASYGVIDGSDRFPVIVENYAGGELYHADPTCRSDLTVLDVVTADTLTFTPTDRLCDCTLTLGPSYSRLVDTVMASVPQLRWLRLAHETLDDPHTNEDLARNRCEDTEAWVPLWRPQIAAQLLTDAETLTFDGNLSAHRDEVISRLVELADEANDTALTEQRKAAVVAQCITRLRGIHTDQAANSRGDQPDTVMETLLFNPALGLDLVSATRPALERMLTGEDISDQYVWVILPEITQNRVGSELNLEYTTIRALRAWAEPGMSVTSAGRTHWEFAAGAGHRVVAFRDAPAHIARIPVAALVVAESWCREDWIVVVTGDDTVSAQAVHVAAATTAGEDDFGGECTDWAQLLSATCVATAAAA